MWVPSDLKQINYLLMKKKILLPALATMIFLLLSGNSIVKRNNPAGIWVFEVQNAPQEYSSGTVEVINIKKSHSVIMRFNGSDSRYVGTRVKFEKNTLTFNVNIREQDVAISLKFENRNRMTGKAVTSQDEIPMTLNRTEGK